jgi:hypothetical protein
VLILLRAIAAATFLVAVAACSGCALTAPASDRAFAVWQLSPEQSLTEGATVYIAVVSRLGCNGGVTGSVNSPDIDISEAEVVVTFFVSPGEPQVADCQGNDQIDYEVTLPEALGDRKLVDGACESAEAESTVYCDDGGVRYSP